MSALVTICDGEPRTTSLAIADGTGTEHRAVIQLVRGYKSDLEEFGLVAFEMRPRLKGQHGGGDLNYATFNEPQATLIMTYMKNTPIVREFKKRLVREFYELANGSNFMMQHIRILEDRISRLELKPRPQPEKIRVFGNHPMFRGLSPITQIMHGRGTTLTEWSHNNSLNRSAVSQHVNDLRYFQYIQDLLIRDGYVVTETQDQQRIESKYNPTKGGELMETKQNTETKREETTLVVDVQATNAKFDELCISRSAWARKHFINPAVFYQRLSGQLKITPEIASLLKADNLLVERTLLP